MMHEAEIDRVDAELAKLKAAHLNLAIRQESFEHLMQWIGAIILIAIAICCAMYYWLG